MEFWDMTEKEQLGHISEITNSDLLEEIAIKARTYKVRMKATERVSNDDVLISIFETDRSKYVREAALKRAGIFSLPNNFLGVYLGPIVVIIYVMTLHSIAVFLFPDRQIWTATLIVGYLSYFIGISFSPFLQLKKRYFILYFLINSLIISLLVGFSEIQSGRLVDTETFVISTFSVSTLLLLQFSIPPGISTRSSFEFFKARDLIVEGLDYYRGRYKGIFLEFLVLTFFYFIAVIRV